MHLEADAFLRKFNYTDILKCNFPATTPVNLSSICFGRWPGDHGAIGWRLPVAKTDGSTEYVIQPFTISDHEGRCEISRRDFYLAQGFWKNRISNYFFVNPFAGYPEFSLEWGGESYSRFDTYKPEDAVDIIIEKLKTAEDPTFVCLYYDIVDKTEHKYGVDSAETKKVVDTINRELERLALNCEDTLLVVTADHGHIDIDPISLHPTLVDMCIYANLGLGGSGRFPYFTIKPGRQEEFRKLFLKIHGEHFILLSVDEAIQCQLFNPFGIMKNEVRARIGDFVGVAKTKKTFNILDKDSNHHDKLGGHGSVLKEEMEIPFIVYHS